MRYVHQNFLNELQDHLGRSVKSSLCIPVTAHASSQSETNEVIAIMCLINKRSISSRSVYSRLLRVCLCIALSLSCCLNQLLCMFIILFAV